MMIRRKSLPVLFLTHFTHSSDFAEFVCRLFFWWNRAFFREN